MSLINDALKRAKEAQHQQSPVQPGGPPLRPVDHRPERRSGLWLVLVFAVVFAAAVILLWQWLQTGRSPGPLAGQSPSPVQTAPASTPSPPALPSPPPSPAPTPVSAPEGQPTPSATESSPVRPGEPTTPAAMPAPERPVVAVPPTAPVPALVPAPATNGPARPSPAANPVAEAKSPEPPPKPSALKLQGIIYHPTRPSVVVNGKALFIGDRLNEWRVIAIDTHSVTLANNGRTNILEMP